MTTDNAGATVYVALLRGINVGGHGKVSMADLRQAVESTGCTDVSTYIQSGNVVLTSARAEAALRAALEHAIADRLGVHPTVMVRSADEIAAVVAATPYPDAAEGTVHVAFLHEPPTPEPTTPRGGTEGEELTVLGREIYLHLPGGIGRSKLMVEVGKRCKAPMTVRNWRTVTKLRAMTGPARG
ncbi:MAG TPA: DUF1697 domain-containing protein [Nocardioidaceae bacterium]|nr:DUF1697 domain-containing protein [Nocardioidaceae bacterium]